MPDKDMFFVERRPQGNYAVSRPDSERASDVLPTQAEAIERARELGQGKAPLVERVGATRTNGANRRLGAYAKSWRPPLLDSELQS
jgi:hypothetical protein